MQVSLIHLYAQQRQLHNTFQQYQVAVQSPNITQQQRSMFMAQLNQLQPNIGIMNHQLSQQLALAKSMGAAASAAVAVS
ncbi:hypothetical protein GGF38_001651, partial [Coemansia sp. RSA 25]